MRMSVFAPRLGASLLLQLALAFVTRAESSGADGLTTAKSAQASGGISVVPQNAAKSAINSLNRGFYNSTDGRWDTQDAWWLSGVAMMSLLDYMQLTETDDYLEQVEHTVAMQRKPLPWWLEGGGDFRADSTDDTGWWALALVKLYDLTGSTDYLDLARLDETYIYSYWNTSTCNGGLPWDIPKLEYKNAIGDELYIKLAAVLHSRVPGDTEYLKRAIDTWTWFNASGMINKDHLINDGLTENPDGTCTNNGQTTWTYNQGVILGALVELHRATGNEEYLTEAQDVANAVIDSQTLSPGGILKEPCDPSAPCPSDQSSFKGLFMRNLAELNSVLGKRPYDDYLSQNAGSTWQHARNSSDFYSTIWSGPFSGATVGSQVSAINLLLSFV